ncbi:MAG: S41 family peptidase [bacterium]|nr:S41 family peptidase [bacterium]
MDRIILIGTGETKELTTFEAVSQIRGEKGSEVELFIERVDKSGEKSYLTLKVIRDIIDIPSVKGEVLMLSGQRIGHLEVSIFGDQTNKLMNQAITHFLDEKVEAIILDLRSNGGGLLTSAVDLAGHFLEPESLVVQTKYRNYEDVLYHSKGFGELSHIPMVILINQLSASASEILALALRENRNILIVGEESFGKGSIQTLSDFDNNSSLKYTIGKRYGPKGTSIDEVGIVPDIEVVFDGTGYVEQRIDNQLEEAKQLLYQQLHGQ